jgi:hypothetical protein
MTLEAALARLVTLLPTAQQRWDAQQREEDEEYDSGDDQLWLALEFRYGGWRCAYVYQPDEATEVAYSAVAGSALGAATALLAMMEEQR